MELETGFYSLWGNIYYIYRINLSDLSLDVPGGIALNLRQEKCEKQKTVSQWFGERTWETGRTPAGTTTLILNELLITSFRFETEKMCYLQLLPPSRLHHSQWIWEMQKDNRGSQLGGNTK